MDGSIGETLPPWELSRDNHPLIKERVKAAADAIFHQIASGHYSYGTRLASERDLAKEFGLSRAAIRQVIDFLETYAVVKRQPNSGTFVNYVPPKNGFSVRVDNSGNSHLLDISAGMGSGKEAVKAFLYVNTFVAH